MKDTRARVSIDAPVREREHGLTWLGPLVKPFAKSICQTGLVDGGRCAVRRCLSGAKDLTRDQETVEAESAEIIVCRWYVPRRVPACVVACWAGECILRRVLCTIVCTVEG